MGMENYIQVKISEKQYFNVKYERVEKSTKSLDVRGKLSQVKVLTFFHMTYFVTSKQGISNILHQDRCFTLNPTK